MAIAGAKTPSVPPVQTDVPQTGWASWLINIARTLNLVLKGKINAVAPVTLTPNATSTVLSDTRIGIFSAVLLEAQTASAAAARNGGLYVVPGMGQATITHPSNAAADQNFMAIILG